jgi:hypothetical protein
MLEHWSKPAEMTMDENQVLRNKKRKCGAVTFLAIYVYYTQLLSFMGKILYKGEDEFDPMHLILRSESVAPHCVAKVWPRPFSTSVLDEGNFAGSRSWPLQFLGKAPSNRYIWRLGVPQNWSGRFEGGK